MKIKGEKVTIIYKGAKQLYWRECKTLKEAARVLAVSYGYLKNLSAAQRSIIKMGDYTVETFTLYETEEEYILAEENQRATA